MEHLLGGGGGRRKLCSKALSCFTLVFFCLLLKPTTVTARMLATVPPSSSSSAVQEYSSTDEVAVLKEIASALSSNWTWIKAGVASFLVLFLIELVKIKTGVYVGVRTQCRLDRRKEAMAQEDPLAASANPSADPPARQADREENQTNSRGDRVVEALIDVNMDPNRRENSHNWPPVEPEFSTEKGKEAVIDERIHHWCLWIEDGSRSPEQLMSSRRRRQVDMPA